jgi:Cdc6-like AAA superfamily ATPase
VVIATREVVALSDKPGAFIIIKRGQKNTRVAPSKDPNNSFVVPNTSLVSMDVNTPSTGGTDEEWEHGFEVLADLTECVARKFSNGIFITGPGGTGKTYTVMEKMRELNYIEGTDFIIIKGYSTPAALYNTLYRNLDKVIILDDCDSVLSCDTGLNVLKAVLDTTPIRTVSWNTNSSLIEAPQFDFTGQIIFISNKDPKEANRHLGALRTRVLTVNIAGTPEQMRDRCILLMPKISSTPTPQGHPPLTRAQQESLCQFIRDNYTKIPGLSLRYAVNLVSVYRFRPSRWQELALKIR